MFIVLARQEAQNISRDPDPADGEKLSLQWSKMWPTLKVCCTTRMETPHVNGPFVSLWAKDHEDFARPMAGH